jgi:hypothetical protein
MHGYQWQDRHAAGYLSLQLQEPEEMAMAIRVFTDWLTRAEDHLSPDVAAWGKLLIRHADRPEDIVMMVDFVAWSYRRHLEHPPVTLKHDQQ